MILRPCFLLCYLDLGTGAGLVCGSKYRGFVYLEQNRIHGYGNTIGHGGEDM